MVTEKWSKEYFHPAIHFSVTNVFVALAPPSVRSKLINFVLTRVRSQ